MIPKTIPTFKPDDILIDDIEYRKGNKATIVGWLKELFLYGDESIAYINVSVQDRQDYGNAISMFKSANSIPRSVDLHDWEDEQSITKQCKALNKFKKAWKKGNKNG